MGEGSSKTKLFLHACCGPCSLEPVRILTSLGYAPTLVYINPNIEPADEYKRRLAVLRSWAKVVEVPCLEGPNNKNVWQEQVACFGSNREKRCAACYKLRLEASARMACELGFTCLSTTLAVSPYQLFDICGEALANVCETHGLTPVWLDFRPYYAEATRRSRALGMYRQNYCGCRFSAAEAARERTEARDKRKLSKDIERLYSIAQTER
ncbi:MAG: epoxyqueuosine reductase QueH [Coriobacteriales bacterium]|nr:epoxyqueuosine reductase QueH [Coriobacteriales bacterium]